MKKYKWKIVYNNMVEEGSGSFSQFAKHIKRICANPNVFDAEVHISESVKL